jgi:hypothetical protein
LEQDAQAIRNVLAKEWPLQAKCTLNVISPRRRTWFV